MKKSLTGMVALLAGAFVAHSQGTVSFLNYGNTALKGSYVYITLSTTHADIGGAAGATTGNPATDYANGNDWTVELYGALGTGDSASSLVPCTVAGGGFAEATMANGANDGVAGTWYSSAIAQVPGTAGTESATVQLRAWYNDGGTITTYEAALATPGGATGESALAAVNSLGGVPSGGGPSATAPNLPAAALGSFVVTPTPEPSTVALGVMGASAFLLRLRRKK